MKISFIKALVLCLIIFSVLYSKHSDFKIHAAFNKDSCEVGELVHLNVVLKWKGSSEDLNVKELIVPSQSWYKIEETGTSCASINSDSANYKFNICFLFLAENLYELENISLKYIFKNEQEETIQIVSPKIVVTNKHFEYPTEYIYSYYIFIIFILLMCLLIIWVLFKYNKVKKNILNSSQYSSNERIINEYMLQLNQLFNKKNINYKDSLLLLFDLINKFKKNHLKHFIMNNENISEKILNLLKKINLLKKHKFVSFNQFENVYNEFYFLISNINTENSMEE